MKRLIVSITLIALTSCAGKKMPSDNSPLPEQKTIPSECTYVETTAHEFLSWGLLLADRYSCAFHANMTCSLYVTADRSEIRCRETSPLSLNGAPSGCSPYGSGWHSFDGVGLFDVNTYQCANTFGLYCHYYRHWADVSHQDVEEMLCIDHDYFD